METTGIVIIRNILTLDEQIKLIEIIKRKDNLMSNDGKWNFFGIRGRNFCGLSKYPTEDAIFLQECAQKFKMETEKRDQTLIWTDVTHLLTLWYPNVKGIGWHKDGFGGNDGDEGAPVYSLTLGNSCIFEYKLVDDKNQIPHEIELCSGDIIVFGGPQRLMYHRVKSIKQKSFNRLKDFNARINLTFRTCTDFNDDMEANYQTESYTKKLSEKWNKK